MCKISLAKIMYIIIYIFNVSFVNIHAPAHKNDEQVKQEFYYSSSIRDFAAEAAFPFLTATSLDL